jgi:phage baseplate assembly protein W
MARYTDLDLNFDLHPLTKDVTVLNDMEALKRSVRNLVLTSRYDRPFKPQIDCGVRQYLFELFSPVVSVKIKNAIERVIRNFEPRVELLNVLVRTNEDRNAYDVTIVFRPKNINQTTQVTFVLERTR